MSDGDELISAHLDGELDDEGHHRFEEWLAGDPERQRRFLRMAIAHQALGASVPARSVRPTRMPSRRRQTPFASRIASAALIAAALAVAIGGAWWATATRGSPTSSASDPLLPPVATETLATVTAASDATARRAGVDEGARPGLALMAGDRLSCADGGMAELRLADGTRLTLDAGAALTLADGGKRIEIASGRIAAEVTPQPVERPLCFATPEAFVRVVGTALAIASGEGETTIAVTHGSVAVSRNAAGTESVAVSAGQRLLAAPSQPLLARPLDAALGATYAVGAGQAYATLAALPELAPGDVVEIHAGTYHEGRIWNAHGTALRPIVIRGVGAEPPLLDGEGVALSGVGAVPRALFQIAGDHYLIEHLAFANARNGENAAGIRILDAHHTIIRRCRIARCDDGIVAGDDIGELLIEDCDIGFCGAPEKDGYTHDVYIGGASATVRGCRIHDALHGQALKSSCRYLELIGNRIGGAEDGEITLIEGPGSEQAEANVVLIGNLIASKSERRGNSQRFIEVDRENGGQRGGSLQLIGNTLVAADPRVVFIATDAGAMRVVCDGNIFVGSSHIARLGAGGMVGRRNWLPSGAEVPTGLIDAIVPGGDDPGFLAAARGDFRPRAGSPVVGAAPERLGFRDGAGRLRTPQNAGPAEDIGVLTRRLPLSVGAFDPP